jgi:polyhydroxyalkanoate synthesis repressor PhaR
MLESRESGGKRLEIKKYANRRYYDATHSRHLTLEEIRAMIQDGFDIRVIDAKTSDDITGQVLTQLILELDTPKLDSLPVPLLLRLIRMNDQLVKDFIEKYFNQALHSFLDYQRQVEEQIRRTHGLPSAFPSVSAWTKAFIEPFASVFAGQGQAKPDGVSTSSAVPSEAAELRKVVENLQQELAKQKRGKKKLRKNRKSPAVKRKKGRVEKSKSSKV